MRQFMVLEEISGAGSMAMSELTRAVRFCAVTGYRFASPCAGR